MSKFSFEPDKYKHGNIAVTHQTSSNLSTTIRLSPDELRELVSKGQEFLDTYEPPKQIAGGSVVTIKDGAQCYSQMAGGRIDVPGFVEGYLARVDDGIDHDGDYFITMLSGPDKGRGFWVAAEYIQEDKS